VNGEDAGNAVPALNAGDHRRFRPSLRREVTPCNEFLSHTLRLPQRSADVLSYRGGALVGVAPRLYARSASIFEAVRSLGRRQIRCRTDPIHQREVLHRDHPVSGLVDALLPWLRPASAGGGGSGSGSPGGEPRLLLRLVRRARGRPEPRRRVAGRARRATAQDWTAARKHSRRPTALNIFRSIAIAFIAAECSAGVMRPAFQASRDSVIRRSWPARKRRDLIATRGGSGAPYGLAYEPG